MMRPRDSIEVWNSFQVPNNYMLRHLTLAEQLYPNADITPDEERSPKSGRRVGAHDLQMAPVVASSPSLPYFLSRLSLSEVAEFDRPRRYSKAFGIPSNLLDWDPFERPSSPLRRMSAERSAFDV
jgi:hypothetical protein